MTTTQLALDLAAAGAITYFASGSNRAPEIRGFASLRHPVGVAAPELDAEAEAELSGSADPVFVDSGAFGEVKFNSPHKCGRGKKCSAGDCIGVGNLPYPNAAPFTFVTVKPIDGRQWTAILALYSRLARKLGRKLYVVAPDKVGDQAATLERLRTYRLQLAAIRAAGANIIVPIQKGQLSQADFDLEVAAVLGFDDYIRGIPAKKAATSRDELAAFIEAARPARVHLLGMGPTSPSFEEYRAAATAHGAELSCDSMLIKANVGRSNGRDNHADERKGGRRCYTKAQDIARELLEAGNSDIDPRELGITIAFSTLAAGVDRWAHMTAACRASLAA